MSFIEMLLAGFAKAAPVAQTVEQFAVPLLQAYIAEQAGQGFSLSLPIAGHNVTISGSPKAGGSVSVPQASQAVAPPTRPV